ncbi:MAG: hypothetical protein AAFR81_04025 [Chloroflexota bacterium]
MKNRKTELASALADAPMTADQKLVVALRNDINHTAHILAFVLQYLIDLQKEGTFTSHLLQDDLAQCLERLDRPDLIPHGTKRYADAYGKELDAIAGIGADSQDTTELPAVADDADSVDLQALFARDDVTYECVIETATDCTILSAQDVYEWLLDTEANESTDHIVRIWESYPFGEAIAQVTSEDFLTYWRETVMGGSDE